MTKYVETFFDICLANNILYRREKTLCEQAPPCAHKGLSGACPETCPEPCPESLVWSLFQAVKFLNPHRLRGQPCPLPCPALSVPCPDLQRRIPAKCAAVSALSAALTVSLIRTFCVRPPRGSWTKPLNKAFFKLLLVRALSASSVAWILPCSGLVRFFSRSFFFLFNIVYIYIYIYVYILCVISPPHVGTGWST